MEQKQRYHKLENRVRELEKKLTEARKREQVMKENIEKYGRLFKNKSEAVPSGEFADIHIDEAKRKEAEKTLRESEEKYRHIFENIQDVYYEVTLDGIIREVSRSIEEISAYKREDLKGKSLYDVYADPKKRDGFLGVLLKNEKVTDYEIILKDKDGSAVNCSITARLLRDKRGNPEKIVGTMRDITKRKRMEEELRESEETLKAILAVCPVGIGLVCDRTLNWANGAMYRILGYEEGSLIGEDAKLLYLDDEEWNRVGSELYPGMEKTGIGQVETRWIRKEGGVIDCHVQASPLHPNDPGKGHIVAVMDITDRKRAEEQIHALTHQLMKAQENERQRISLYLHDDVAQNLSTLKIGLESMFDDPQTPLPELRQRVAQFSQILQSAISAVRDLAYDQRPPSLDQLGLIQAVFQYCESFSEKYGLGVDFQSAGMDDLKLDFDTEISLYRLIQEALTNVRKHAEASRATVKLVAAHPHIILRIEDNGRGFDVKGRLLRPLDEKRMGLQSIEERVNILNGKLRIQSRPGEGTKIFAEVPYRERKIGSEKKHPNHR
jgi:PAS domain S-box-containing protein